MTPQQFIAKWQGCQLAERAFFQQYFNDMCASGMIVQESGSEKYKESHGEF